MDGAAPPPPPSEWPSVAPTRPAPLTPSAPLPPPPPLPPPSRPPGSEGRGVAPGLLGWIGIGTALVLLVVVISVSSGASKEAEEADDAASALRDDIDGLEGERDALKEELDGAAAVNADLRGDVRALEDQLDDLESQIAELTAEVPAPDLAGLTKDEAQRLVEEQGWEVEVVEQESGDAPAGTVMTQDPAPGTVMTLGGTLTITVATEPPPAPPSWKTVFSQSGSGTTKTAPFTIPPVPAGNAKLVYSFAGDSNDIVRLVSTTDASSFGELLVNEIGPLSGETFIYTEGVFYIDVTGEQWNVSVQVLE